MSDVTILAYAGSEHLRVASGWNAAIVSAADATDAKATLKANKPTGDSLDSVLDAWTYTTIASAVPSLPNGSDVQWISGVKGTASGKAD